MSLNQMSFSSVTGKNHLLSHLPTNTYIHVGIQYSKHLILHPHPPTMGSAAALSHGRHTTSPVIIPRRLDAMGADRGAGGFVSIYIYKSLCYLINLHHHNIHNHMIDGDLVMVGDRDVPGNGVGGVAGTQRFQMSSTMTA